MTTGEIVRWVIDTFEGHLFTDDPVDTGGATKFGITRRTLEYYRGAPVTKADVKALTLDEAAACAVQVFAVEPRIDQIADWRVQLAVYDYGFHSGQRRAVKALQTCLNDLGGMLAVDGVIGPATLAELRTVTVDGEHTERGCSSRLLALSVLTMREQFMQSIMTANPSQRRFMLGWWVRATKLQQKVLE